MKARRTRRALGLTAVAFLLAALALALAVGSPGAPRLQLRAADNSRAKSALIRTRVMEILAELPNRI